MDLLCPTCDRSIIENESEYENFLATRRKRNNKNYYENYINNNLNFDDFDKRLIDYITSHNKKFHYYLVRCEFILEFDNNFTTKNKLTIAII